MSTIEMRSVRRDSLFLMAALAVEGHGAGEAVKVRNLSERGMMAESDMRMRRGTRVTVALRNIGHVEGRVVWSHGRRMGIAFERAIDPKLARTQVYGGHKSAPAWARAPEPIRRREAWAGALRRV